VLILGDQLSVDISSLKNFDKKTDHVLMAEVMSEASYVQHHPKKIIFIFSAMRHFAQELQSLGFSVHYTKLDDKQNTQNISTELLRISKSLGCEKIIITKPGEYRLLKELESIDSQIKLELREDDRFYCTLDEFSSWIKSSKVYRLENFYQLMRKKHNVLLDLDGKPEGGKWNYDVLNRKPIKKNLKIPPPPKFEADKITQDVINLVKQRFDKNFGSAEPFWFAVTQKQAQEAMDDFVQNKLATFGDYEDAMLEQDGFLFHSILSMYINVGFLEPKKIIPIIEQKYRQGLVPLNSAEGYIRQIIGWREYVRGIYWTFMPDYTKKNYFEHHRKLPEFFWSANTDLNCIKKCIEQTRDESYAHHIQRLMIIGNFSVLTELEPSEVASWFLAVYADAYEWVELPNVYGLALYADGGTMASKPYVSSGNYIKKMSDYCDGCKYDVDLKSGKDACPFNYLYWNFFIKNREKVSGNPRNFVIYNTIKKMTPEKIAQIKKDSKEFLKNLD